MDVLNVTDELVFPGKSSFVKFASEDVTDVSWSALAMRHLAVADKIGPPLEGFVG